jgi:hypothetical protein
LLRCYACLHFQPQKIALDVGFWLTFNTTSTILSRALREKRLLMRNPLRPLAAPKRYLLVTPEIDALLDGHMLSGTFPDISAEVLIGRFVAGFLVTVSRKLTKQKPDVEQIVGADEVWALCARKPIPGWRILGRWHTQDVFVALRPWEKLRLFGNYPVACQEVVDDWQELLGAEPVHKGQSASDYLSGVFRDVD